MAKETNQANAIMESMTISSAQRMESIKKESARLNKKFKKYGMRLWGLQ